MNHRGPNMLTQIRFPDQPGVAPRPRVGYSNGSLTLTDQGVEFGKAIAQGRLWKNGPIGGTWPPGVATPLWKDFFQTEKGTSFLEQGHYTTMLPPDSSELAKEMPGWTRDERFMEMHRRLGYNFQVQAIRHLVAVDKSAQTHVEVDLRNIGIAPFYQHWPVQLALLETSTSKVVGMTSVDTRLRDLGPGDSV